MVPPETGSGETFGQKEDENGIKINGKAVTKLGKTGGSVGEDRDGD